MVFVGVRLDESLRFLSPFLLVEGPLGHRSRQTALFEVLRDNPFRWTCGIASFAFAAWQIGSRAPGFHASTASDRSLLKFASTGRKGTSNRGFSADEDTALASERISTHPLSWRNCSSLPHSSRSSKRRSMDVPMSSIRCCHVRDCTVRRSGSHFPIQNPRGERVTFHGIWVPSMSWISGFLLI